ncbi:MAG: hypothetical protein ACJ8EN_15390, partial [Xanthobacteraceae bacterium]
MNLVSRQLHAAARHRRSGTLQFSSGVAEEAVWCEPVSRQDFPDIGPFTGNFPDSFRVPARSTQIYEGIPIACIEFSLGDGTGNC